jgi:ferredoxin
MGWSEDLIDAAKVDGKPIEAAPPKKRPFHPYKSKAEYLFAQKLIADQNIGIVKWWAYEPITLVIADANGKRCRYTPDFLVCESMCPACMIFYEIKGFLRESARIRFIAAQERYPFWNFQMLRRKATGWEEVM